MTEGGGEPTFSILVAAYNAAATLAETLQSVLAQTDPDWEALIVDDGSTDDTYDVATSFATRDARITVVRQANRGPASARNAAAKRARGRYFCILDSDDIYREFYLERQRAFLVNYPSFDLYSCNADVLDTSGEVKPFFPEYYPQHVVSLGLSDIIERNIIFIAAVISAESFRALGGFRDGLYHAEDYDLWLRALASGVRHLHNPEVLVRYRLREGSQSTAEEQMLESAVAVFGKLAKAYHLNAEVSDRVHRRVSMDLDRLTWIRASANRRLLETRLKDAEYRGARRLFWSSRRAFVSPIKFAVGAVVVGVSPRILAVLLARLTSAREDPFSAHTGPE